MQKIIDQDKIRDLIESLLLGININTDDARQKFLSPDYDRDLHNPFLLPDMEKSVERIFSAITAGEKIAIYADYDCDGIPGAVMMNDFLKDLGVRNLEVYIPNRNTLGYGLHKDILENIISSGFSLLITIDLGTTAKEAIDFAEQSGVNVIVIDHHEPPESLPKPFALINPKLKNSKYPFRDLCGTGVAYRVICAFLDKYREYFNYKKGKEKWFLDLVALSTIADQVPLLQDNRVLAKYGLLVMRKGRRYGIKALAEISKLNISKINEDDINFSIAPKINAASRMDNAFKAFELLSCQNSKVADILAQDLFSLSEKRKVLVAQMMKEVKRQIKNRSFENIICLGNPNWNPGLLGIIASKITEEYKKTAFVWGRTNGNLKIIKGSCRAFGDIDVIKIMEKIKDSLLDMGGHEKAGGFSVKEEEIHNLPVKLEEAFILSQDFEIQKEQIKYLNFYPEMNSFLFFNEFNKMAPFGIGNPKPLFYFENVFIEKVKTFGKDSNHIELSLSLNGNKIKAISFFKKPEDFNPKLSDNQFLNLIGFLEQNSFNNFNSLRIRIWDIN